MEAACQMSSTGEWKGHTEPKVGAVVLNFNSYEDTKTCLSSLLNIAYKEKGRALWQKEWDV